MTAEEDDDDEDVPDFRAFKVSSDDAHFFTDHVDGRAYHCWMYWIQWSTLNRLKYDVCPADEEVPPIKHGASITDRRSTFQPHLAPVVTPRQVGT